MKQEGTAREDCAVIQSTSNNDADLTSFSSGNVVSFHASKLPGGTTIVGTAATTNNESSIHPIQPTFTEGAYEYVKLGQTIRKQLLITDSGVTDAK